MSIGNSHIRVGDDNAEFSTANPIAYDNIFDGGFLEFTDVFSGRYLNLRRDTDAPSNNRYNLHELRVY